MTFPPKFDSVILIQYMKSLYYIWWLQETNGPETNPSVDEQMDRQSDSNIEMDGRSDSSIEMDDLIPI